MKTHTIDLNELREWQSEEKVIFCPKYIFIQRYEYQGPFKTKDEAELLINSI